MRRWVVWGGNSGAVATQYLALEGSSQPSPCGLETVMNLLCPNCQKTLTVPEQFAGQLMKCPLCSGTFTVPALPSGGDPVPAPAAPDPTPAFSPLPEPAAAGEPVPAFSLPASTPATPAFSTSAPEPAFKATPPPATPPSP